MIERVLTWGCMCELVRLRGFTEAMTVGTMRMMRHRRADGVSMVTSAGLTWLTLSEV